MFNAYVENSLFLGSKVSSGQTCTIYVRTSGVDICCYLMINVCGFETRLCTLHCACNSCPVYHTLVHVPTL